MSCRCVFRPITGIVKNQCRGYSAITTQKLTNTETSRKRNELFEKEKARQASHLGRVEKIKVEYVGQPEPCTLIMNKRLSTPFNCAMHMLELLMNRSVLALVNGQPWDMHRPLEEDCELQFLHFKDDDPSLSNDAFWRSCSFILGYVLERAFKEEHYVELCSFPKPDVRSGSFLYDADLKVADWKPTTAELNCMSRIASKLGHEDLKFERLDVDASVALKTFEDNRFKREQIPSIAARSLLGTTVTLYRLGNHVDISRGPLMSSTNLLYRYQVTALHPVESPELGSLTRVQGVATPQQLPIHYWAFDRLCDRAEKLNKAPVPRLFPTKDKTTAEKDRYTSMFEVPSKISEV